MIIAFQTLIYFRESLLIALDWLIPIWPYYKKWTLAKDGEAVEESDEDQVFSDYDEEKGVVFYPPVYAQRYAAVADCLMDERWAGKIEKVVDFGYNDMSFIKYLKDVPGIKCILGVDIESLPLRCSSDLLAGDDYAPKKESPLQITLFEGNAADPDYRLIGCDAVVAIEMIEHMLPHDLERLVHTVFGFIKPQIAVITTPNGDFNVLFKALEKNGLRRLDHFFEWSREQFHDWCSNIVTRYPDYTVTCKGVGPGPPGTERLGCCSQLALFICKDYHKQKDLDLNCLALVANAPKPKDLDEMTDSWESPDPITETNMLCAPENSEFYPELMFSEKQSYMTIGFSPEPSVESFECKDQFSQCNIEAERGRNFIMFDEEILCYAVLIPQRKVTTKVYEFEDVASRLNCSTFQVKKFSKTTQNLMARNKLDSLVHTREIVDEIRHMTKMLNFNKDTWNKCSAEESKIWNNINWGDNAPYWNQYYKIIKEFNYPFETKSDECRILDLISDEINRLIDTQDNQFTVDSTKLEIPLDHLMQTVSHITDDMEKVKDLLDWNGYEIVDNVLIYSRLVIDNTSVASMDDEWQDNDALSDWDTTDVQSMSDASTMMPDMYGRSLRRALDLKVKKLRSLLTADEDITTELDRIVCRLMMLALRMSKDHQTPPPASWMQRKLLDLLSLTEKAIERRRKHFIENYPLKALEYETPVDKRYEIENDDTAEKILEKYLMLSSDFGNNDFVIKSEVHCNEENLSNTSIEMEPFVLGVRGAARAAFRFKFYMHLGLGVLFALKTLKRGVLRVAIIQEPNSTYGKVRLESIKSDSKEEIRFQVTQAWLDGDYDAIFPTHNVRKSNEISSDSNLSNSSRCSYEVTHENYTQYPKEDKLLSSSNKYNKQAKKSKVRERRSKNKLIKKMSKKRSSTGQLAKKYSKNFEFIEYQSYTFNKTKKSFMDLYNGSLRSTPSKPIPRNLIELCYQDLATEKNPQIIDFSARKHNNSVPNTVAATKESFFIDIVSEDIEETIALRRTIATEMDQNSDIIEPDAIFETVINVTKDDSFDRDHMAPVKIGDSETIFLYDLNEPSTSKGIRHVSADVQCCTDFLATCQSPSAVNSLINASNIRETGIKIGDSYMNLGLKKNSVDFGTVTDENKFYCDFLSAFNKNSIKIKASATNINNTVECSTMTSEHDLDTGVKLRSNYSNVLTSNTISDLRLYRDLSKCQLARRVNQNNTIISQKNSITRYVRPKLSCCGIYIHSYRDRYVSEDVVFQGEWQKNGPKVLVKKNPCAQIILRKHESSIKKKKNDSKENVCSWKLESKVTQNTEKITVHKPIRHAKTKQEAVTRSSSIKQNLNNLEKSIRQGKKVKKVASKVATSITTSRSLKNISALAKTKSITKSNVPKIQNTASKKADKHSMDNMKSNVTVDRLSESADCANQALTNKKMPSLIRSKTEELKNNVLKSKSDKPRNKTYLVFRNEIETATSLNSSAANSKPLTKINSAKSNYSPPSQKSSPSSSPSSIATVRLLPTRTKTYLNKNSSLPLDKNNSGNISVEKAENSKIKIDNRRLSLVSYENKENLPETSKKWNNFKNDADKSSRTTVCDKNKKVRNDSPPSIVRKKSENTTHSVSSSNTKLLKRRRVISPPPLNNASPKNSKSRFMSKENLSRNSGECSVAEISHMTRSSTPVLQVTSRLNIDVQEHKNEQKAVKQSHSRINAAMKQLIEERLNFIKKSQDDSDSETVILSRVNHEESINESISPISYKTVLTNENTSNISGSDIESAILNYSFDSDQDSSLMGTIHSRLPSFDNDLLSFKSTESPTKLSSCVQNALDKTLVPQQNSDTMAVRDIFERKDQNVVKTTGNVLAVQVFSGFSMNGEPVIGDQSEYINLVDPETGNLALDVARQVTSEELFVSGRSSDTYQTCNVEDEAFVPNWLFHVISQQQSAEIPEEAQEFPGQDDDEEPVYDVNGNTMEAGLGVGVGAGDGRGMHSDQSQDSSGRGTSLSSSDVSSGPQSEAIIIDPSAFLGSAAVPMSGPIVAVAVESSEASFRTVETMETDDEARHSRENTQRRRNRAARASDVDADVSSLETDAADSDN